MYLTIYAFILALGIASYVLQGIGLSAMLKATGCQSPWRAWVPILNVKALGDLADKYDNGKKPGKLGTKLLAFSLSMLGCCLLAVLAVMLLVAQSLTYGETVGEAFSVLFSLLLIILLYVAMLVFSILYMVYYFIALWHVMKIFGKSDPTGLLVLCIFVTYAIPFIILTMRNNPPHNLRDENGDTDSPFPPYPPQYPPYPPYPPNQQYYPPYPPQYPPYQQYPPKQQYYPPRDNDYRQQ